MKINQLALQNFRCFEEYELKLGNRFTLLIGDNGSGKTAILDALAIAAGAFLLGVPDILASDKLHISRDDVRYEELTMGQTAIKETAVFANVVVWAKGIVNQKEIEWARHKDIKTNSQYAKELTNLVKKLTDEKTSQNTLFPVIVGYSTGRLWNQLQAREKKIKRPSSRFEGYQDCLKPASDQKRFFSWFKTQELAALQKNERRHVLEAVREAIISMIPDAKHVWWDMDWDELRIETVIKDKTQTVPFHLLSDGYRNMIGMTADIAYRMATLNPQLEIDVIKQTEGIVLIDEIDLHLHPNWQGVVVERLLNTFPKVQFVASSHSPFIIQSLYHRKDCLLWDLEKNQALEITSKSIEDIAEDQQGVEIPQQSRRFIAMENAAENYYRVLKQIPPASDDEKQQLKQRLDELLLPFSDDPAFQAFLKMERLAAEA